MQISPSYPRFWTTDRQPLTGDQLAAAQRAYDSELASGITFDYSVEPQFEVAKSEEEQEKFDYTVALNHRQLPMQAANTSLVTIEDQLAKVQKSIARERPDLAETTESNPKHGGQSPINLQLVDYNFKDVKGQLEGKIAFKELIAATWKKYDFGPEIKVDPADFRGGDSLEMLALRLVPSKD